MNYGPGDYEEKICLKYPKIYLRFYGQDAHFIVSDVNYLKKVLF